MPGSYPRIIAHRGGGALAPENTLAGIAFAARLGCRAVEFDVMLSKDGVPVLIHDETLDRTTDGKGRVADHTLAQLRACDAGITYGQAFRGEPIPALEDALAQCAALGLWANVEIKPSSGLATETGAVVGRLLAREWRGQGVVSSFSDAALVAARAAHPDARYAWLTEAIPADWAKRLRRLGCSALHCRARDAESAAIAAIAAAGIPVACYTVNRRSDAERLFAAGAAAIFTDRPDLWSPDEM